MSLVPFKTSTRKTPSLWAAFCRKQGCANTPFLSAVPAGECCNRREQRRLPRPCRARLTVHRPPVPAPWQAASSPTQHRPIPHQSAAHWLNVTAEMGSGSWGGFRQNSFGSALLSGTVLKTSAVDLPARAGKKIQLRVEKRRGKLVAGGICAFQLNCQQLKNGLFKPGNLQMYNGFADAGKSILFFLRWLSWGLLQETCHAEGTGLEFSSPALPIRVLPCSCNYGIFIVSTICTECARVPFGFRKSLVNKHIALRIWVGG